MVAESCRTRNMLAHPRAYLGTSRLTESLRVREVVLSGRNEERGSSSRARWDARRGEFSGRQMLDRTGLREHRLGARILRVGNPVEKAALMRGSRRRRPALVDDPGEARDAERLGTWFVATRVMLSIFGTFITRSGVINSIHVPKSPIGGVPASCLCGVFSVGADILACRSCARGDELESLVSREASSYNTLLLVAELLTILGRRLCRSRPRDRPRRAPSRSVTTTLLHSFGRRSGC